MSFTLSVAPVAVTTSNGTTVVISLSGCSVGDNIIVGILWFDNTNSITISSVTVSGEANATLISSKFRDSFNTAMQFASLPAITGSGTKTVTVTASSSVSFGAFQAFAMAVGGGTTTFGTLVTQENASNPATQSVLTTAANALIVSVAECNSADPDGGHSTGFTTITLANLNFSQGGQYQLDAGAAGSRNMTYPTCFNDTAICTVTFNAAAAAVALVGQACL